MTVDGHSIGTQEIDRATWVGTAPQEINGALK